MFGGIVVTKVADISVADVALADNIATLADVVHFTRYHSSSLSRNLIQSMVIERQNTLERTKEPENTESQPHVAGSHGDIIL